MKTLFHVHVFRFRQSTDGAFCSILSASCTTFSVCMQKKMTGFPSASSGPCPPQVVMFFLSAERALHRCRPYPGKFLSNMVSFHYLCFNSKQPLMHLQEHKCHYPFRVKYDLRPSFGLRLLLTSPKFSAIA